MVGSVCRSCEHRSATLTLACFSFIWIAFKNVFMLNIRVLDCLSCPFCYWFILLNLGIDWTYVRVVSKIVGKFLILKTRLEVWWDCWLICLRKCMVVETPINFFNFTSICLPLLQLESNVIQKTIVGNTAKWIAIRIISFASWKCRYLYVSIIGIWNLKIVKWVLKREIHPVLKTCKFSALFYSTLQFTEF